MITLRFVFDRGSFSASFTDQSESLFIPAPVRRSLVMILLRTELMNATFVDRFVSQPWFRNLLSSTDGMKNCSHPDQYMSVWHSTTRAVAPVHHGGFVLDLRLCQHVWFCVYLFNPVEHTVSISERSHQTPTDLVRSFPIHNMTPIWIFPAYPLLLVAPFASNFIDALPSDVPNINVVAITFGGTEVPLLITGRPFANKLSCDFARHWVSS